LRIRNSQLSPYICVGPHAVCARSSHSAFGPPSPKPLVGTACPIDTRERIYFICFSVCLLVGPRTMLLACADCIFNVFRHLAYMPPRRAFVPRSTQLHIFPQPSRPSLPRGCPHCHAWHSLVAYTGVPLSPSAHVLTSESHAPLLLPSQGCGPVTASCRWALVGLCSLLLHHGVVRLSR